MRSSWDKLPVAVGTRDNPLVDDYSIDTKKQPNGWDQIQAAKARLQSSKKVPDQHPSKIK